MGREKGKMQVHSTRVCIRCCAEQRGATNLESSLRMTDFGLAGGGAGILTRGNRLF
jgi:hypothetical protein